MKYLKNAILHLHTVNKHRFLVMEMCFRCGMYRQGLIHDLSKYSPSEFITSVIYFQGYRSPISAEKEAIGYSKAWFHHKGRNRHHWEYWTDRDSKTNALTSYEMPFNYMLESVIDKIAASKTYKKELYNDGEPYNFFTGSKEYQVINKKTRNDIACLLKYLKDNGEKKALKYYKSLYRDFKKDRSFTLTC